MTFSIAAGTYSSPQTVSLSSNQSGTTIYYTTDGSTPTTSSKVYSSPITVSTSETIEAIGVTNGVTSPPVVVSYVITPPAAPVFSIAAGTYTAQQSVTITTTASGATIYYTIDGSTPTASSTAYNGPVVVAISETLRAVAIVAGSSSSVTSATYMINPAAAAPTFSVAAGTYTSTQTVALASATPGAVIYYTTDGTTPTSSSTHNTGPIIVSTTETIEAIATASGFSSSAVASALYTINSLPKPVVTVAVSPTTFALTSPPPVAVHVSCNSACGQVNLQIDGHAWQTASLDGTGSYSTSAFPSLSIGSHTLQAFYLGNPSYAAAQSDQVAFTTTTASSGVPHVSLSTYFLEYDAAGGTRDVVLTNSGSAPLTLSGMSFVTPYFTQTNTCGSTVAAGASCTISIVDRTPHDPYKLFPLLEPSFSGGDQLTIASNDPAGTSGIRVFDHSSLNETASNLTFAPVAVGSSSSSLLAIYKSDSICNLTSSNSEFHVSASVQLPGAGCQYSITFTPSAAGVRIGALTFGQSGNYLPVKGIGVTTASSQVTITPASVTLRDEPGPEVFTLSNFNATTLGIQSISVDPPLAQTNNCGSSLPALSICTISITFPQPAIAQSVQGFVTVQDDGGTQYGQVSAIIDPIVEYGSWPLDKKSPALEFPFGGDPYPDSATELGPNQADFGVQWVPYRLGTITPSVTFAPKALGQRYAGLTTVTLPAYSNYGTSLRGTGLAAVGGNPLITLSPIYPQETAVGTSITFTNLVLSNAGGTTVNISGANSASISGANASDFQISSLSCATALAPGDQCSSFNVAFTPTTAGVRSANISIKDSTSGTTFTFPISATGTPAGPQVTGATGITAQLNSSNTVTFTAAPLGGDAVAAYINTEEFPAGSSNAYSLTKSTCAQGESPCQLQLQFSPVDTAFPGSINVTFVDEATGSATVVPIQGSLSSGTLSLNPTSIDFGTRGVNVQSVPYTITLNSANGTNTFTAPVLAGPNASEFIMTTNCTTSLSSGSCTINVSIDPTSTGTKSVSVVVMYGNNNSQTLTTALTAVAQ